MSRKHTVVHVRLGGVCVFVSTALHPIIGVQGRRWQLDYRPDGWLPFSVRNGRGQWHILHLGPLGVVTLGRVTR